MIGSGVRFLVKVCDGGGRGSAEIEVFVVEVMVVKSRVGYCSLR